MSAQRHIAIIGAGPIGLEAALFAVERGYRVSVFEQFHEVAAYVREWGHVRMFSPFGMNSSERGRGVLRAAGHALPRNDELLTGREFAARYLEPLSRLPELAEAVRLNTWVHYIGRRDALKTELIGDRRRADQPFRLAIGSPLRHVEADVVFDCSGTYGQHNWLGAGGIPCPGEFERLPPGDVTVIQGSLVGGPCLEYRLPEVLRPNSAYADGTTLVVGSGYSAATNVVALATLQVDRPETRVIWLTRREADAPLTRIADDRLRERDRLAEQANALACSGCPPVTWKPGYCVRRLSTMDNAKDGRTRWIVDAQSRSGSMERFEVDSVIANVGFRPARWMYEELHVNECYASQGPMKLAAKLLGETGGDCLDQRSHGPESLRNPEPNFFILGSKSYGRNSSFLLQVGLQQIEDVFTLFESS